jgi:vitamin B12 transporter
MALIRSWLVRMLTRELAMRGASTSSGATGTKRSRKSTATHNLSLVGKYWFDKLHLQLSGTYSYGTPRAYFDPNQPGYNQGRTPSFQQLDLSLSHLTHLFGQYTIVHLAMTNVLGRDNTFGYRYATTPDAGGHYARVAVRQVAPQLVVAALLISINKKTPGDTSVAPD